MSEQNITDIEQMLIFTLIEKGFSESSAITCIKIIKREAWREGYDDGRASVHDWFGKFDINPYD